MSTDKFLLTLTVCTMLAGCSHSQSNEWFVSHNGNMPSQERLEAISAGNSKDEVLRTLGAPSSVVSLDKNTWIYMSSDVKRVAFFAPQEINRDVLTVNFDDKDKVVSISRYSQKDGRDVAINSDETPAQGEKIGFFRKYFGGVGQYNPLSAMGK